MANDRLDIIIFGATGFTGQQAVKYAAHLCKEWQLKFGIAGRRKEVLEAVLKEFAPDTENIPIILANVEDEESVKKMTERTKVLVNCCGPYRFYGEAVIKACIATHTHYIDVTCELQFMCNMQLLYDKAAREAGVCIVMGCGADSILIDLYMNIIQRKFEGKIKNIEIYWFLEETCRPLASYGAWKSIMYNISHWSELKEIQAKLYPKYKPAEITSTSGSRGLIHKSDVVGGWSVRLPMIDQLPSFRTSYFLYDRYKENLVQTHAYMTFKSFLGLLVFLIGIMVFCMMSFTAYTRKLLLKVRYPTLFSGGFVKHDLTHKLLERSRVSVTFRVVGWSEKLTELPDKYTDLPNKELIAKVNGGPPYNAACIALILSAIMILKEADKIPDKGGVFSPGVVFRKTSLIEKLNKSGIKFEVIKCIEK